MLPLACTLAMATQYIQNGSELDIQQKAFQQWNDKTNGLVELQSFQQTSDRLMTQTTNCLLESVDALPRYNQWTSLLTAITKNLPESFVLHELAVTKKMRGVEIPKRGKPDQLITIAVPERTLRVSVYHSGNEINNAAIQEFIEKLQSTYSLKSQVEKIRLVGHQLDTQNDKEIIQYDIDITLKTAY